MKNQQPQRRLPKKNDPEKDPLPAKKFDLSRYSYSGGLIVSIILGIIIYSGILLFSTQKYLPNESEQPPIQTEYLNAAE